MKSDITPRILTLKLAVATMYLGSQLELASCCTKNQPSVRYLTRDCCLSSVPQLCQIAWESRVVHYKYKRLTLKCEQKLCLPALSPPSPKSVMSRRWFLDMFRIFNLGKLQRLSKGNDHTLLWDKSKLLRLCKPANDSLSISMRIEDHSELWLLMVS